jgi:ABC-type transport system involved in multi-copper enzyme maturation permease subunit
MINKFIVCLVILSLLSYLGCSRTIQITKDEFNEGYIKDEDKREIYLTTKDSSYYSFPENSYKIQKDTLYGEGQKIDNQGNEIPFSGKIAIVDMESITGEGVDISLTIGIIILGAFFAVLLLARILSADWSGMGEWGK